jgi:hypothetical protein
VETLSEGVAPPLRWIRVNQALQFLFLETR